MNHSDDPKSPLSTRREFCVRTCQAVSLLTLGAAFQACGGSRPRPRCGQFPTTFANNVVTVSV